ncbi:MAG TPA: MgtC/SapB family protein [Pirellulales bacterium]|nr:MgtC/SapB family protein [Pirellulales bacterium]
MPLELAWHEVAIRLALTVFAGGCIGLNRGEHGQPAGLRTTILVCVAAAVSMIQANLLLATAGKTPDSFIVLDLMRLPLGVLSGMGFIGAGAILRRDNLVMGVTTAATLWYVTLMGLCFGGGQLGLGLSMLAAGMLVLSGLKSIERRLKQDRHAVLRLTVLPDGPGEDDLRRMLHEAGVRVHSCAFHSSTKLQHRRLRCEVRWRSSGDAIETPPVVARLAQLEGVVRLDWRP